MKHNFLVHFATIELPESAITTSSEAVTMPTLQTQMDSSQTISLPLLTYFKDKTAILKQKLKESDNIYIFIIFSE